MGNAGAIDTVLWPGARHEVGADLLNGGTYANKTGYHNSRNNLRRDHPDDYSIQLPIDKEGPGDLGSAIDLTFKSAQGGDFRNIAKYSKRLLEAGKAKDPRAYPLREFQGNIDDDRDVEGWSFYRDRALTSSDKSHLWHIHLSIHRKYINDAAAMRSILEIWNGEDMALSDSDIAKIAHAVHNSAAVDVYKPPPGERSTTNPNWKFQSEIEWLVESVHDIKKHLNIP